MGARRFNVLALVAPLALGAACDWRTFDEIKERTPVMAVAPSDAFGVADDFGRYVLPFTGAAMGKTGGRFMVSAASTGAVSLVEIDAKGAVSSLNNAAREFEGEEITALAEVPGGKQVLLGAHEGGPTHFGAVFVLSIGEALSIKLLGTATPGDIEFGLGVGAGSFTGSAAPDFAVLSRDLLTVFPDGDPARAVVVPPAAECPLSLSTSLAGRDRSSRAMLIADVKGTGTTQQIVVGTPTSGAPGAVSVFDVDPTSGQATCAFSYSNVAPRFGQALALGHFDADDQVDLLIGAPPEGAFWIRGPLTATSPILPVAVTKTASSRQLGAAVGAGDVDKEPGDEAFVGDPEATVGGKALAGEVHIASGPLLDKAKSVVRRQAPAANDAFGVQVGALPFCASGCGTAGAVTSDLLLVGSRTRVFSFFVLGKDGPKDPRTP
jgi:hypothetical protein